MGKLLMLKEWLTLDEVVTRLSATAEEPVTEADILRLAIDNHLQLSVYIDDNLTARDMEFEVDEVDGMRCLVLGEAAAEPCRITGLWDLAAYGEGLSELERLYRERKGFKPMPRIALSHMGLYLHDEGKTVVMEVLRMDLKFKFTSKAINSDITSEDGDPVEPKTKLMVNADPSMLGEINKLLTQGMRDHDPVFEENLYAFYREHRFPEKCFIVLRREELLSFETKHLGGTLKAELTPTERASSHQIISVLAAMAKVDLAKPYKAVNVLRQAAALHGLDLPASEETIVKFLSPSSRKKR